MYFIGSVIMLLGVALVCYFKHVPLTMFLNPAAIFISFFAIVGVIVSTSNFKTFIRGLNAIISKNYSIDDEERIKAAELFRLLSKSVICASFIGFVIGGSRLPFYTNDTAILGHALAPAVVCLLFGLVMSLVFFEPAVCVLKKPRVKSDMIKEYPKYLGDRLLELCSQNGLTPDDIKKATGIDLKHD